MASKQSTKNKQSNMFRSKPAIMPEDYYFGDKPNPKMHAFVEAHLHERRYNVAMDTYDVPAFNLRVMIENRRDPINDLHIYWSKKPYKAIIDYIRHYTQPGDLVFDPFCGSGGTAIAALMEERKALAIDRSPAATFITKHYCSPANVDEILVAFEQLKLTVKPEIDWLYETRCDRCNGKAITTYTVYSQVFQCPRCLEKIPLFDCIEVASKNRLGKDKSISACPHCYGQGFVEDISTRSNKFGTIPVMVSYVCEAGCRPGRGERVYNDSDPVKRRFFKEYDLGKLHEIDTKNIPHWYPKVPMIKGFETTIKRNLEAQGVHIVADLFTKRNLWAMAAILGAINKLPSAQEPLRFAFSGALWNATKMYRHRELGGGPQAGTYYLAQVFREIHGWTLLDQKVSNLIRSGELTGKLSGEIPVCISTQSSTDLSAITSNSVDYIFTDPPYAGKVQYGELNYLWEAWLDFDIHWHAEEIIVNSVRGRTEADWASMIHQAMGECYRVLKPGRWLSLCYHDTSEGTWTLVQDIMAEVGFLTDNSESALFIDTGQKSYNQLTADKVNKRDLVINFRKPRLGETAAQLTISGDEDTVTFNEKVREIIREFLTDQPGTTKDRIYDEVVSRMVRAGRMEPHNFEELLVQVAEDIREPLMANLFEQQQPDMFGGHEIVRWYLKETALATVDAAESEKEDTLARKVSTFISRKLEADPAAEGVHYSDIFEYYIYTVNDKPRRKLIEWLLDYYYKTPEGTYRLPASKEEEELKERARASGTNRRIKRFVTYLQQSVTIPKHEQPSDATLVDWIRQCKRSGLYEYGKLLYERGGLNLDNLAEKEMVEAEEDYDACIRALARSSQAVPKKTKGKGKPSQTQQGTLDL